MSESRRVLIVDADEQVSGVLTAALIGAGFEAVLAKDGPEAAHKISNETFFFIMADFNTPRVSESGVLEVFAKAATRNGSYLVISTPETSGEIDQKFSQIPRVRLLPKPIDLKALLKLVKEFDQDVHKAAVAPNTMDVKVINPIITCAMQRIGGVFRPALKADKPYLRKESEISGDISAIVGLISPSFKGNVALSFSQASYLQFMSRNLGAELTEIDDDVRDAIVDLVREILDSAQEQYRASNLSVVITNPSIIYGASHSLQHSSKRPPVVLVFQNETRDGFRLEISIQS